MNQFIQKNKGIIAGMAICLVVGGISMSFQNTPFGPIDKLDSLTDTQDTIPSEKPKDDDSKMSMKDFDLLLKNMDKEILKMQKEATKIDFDKLHHQITASLDKVDFDKIKRDLDKTMKDIDFAKIEQGIKTALDEIDWDNIGDEARVSLQDAKKEVEKINMENLKKELEKVKLEIEKSRKEIRKINIDEIMKNASEGITKAKEELRLTKQMFNEMEKDGLINKKEGFTIEYKDKTLFINGKKQSDAIRDKYQQYIKGDSFKISISKD